MKRKVRRYISNILFLIFFGSAVFSAGYLYLDSTITDIDVTKTEEKVQYYETLPQDTTVLFNICDDNILVNLCFSDKTLKVVSAEDFDENQNTVYGYNIDYYINCNYKTVGYLTDIAGGVELEGERYTGVQITEMLEYSGVTKETKKLITEKIIQGISENGFNKDDMLYITENADTNLKFASAYTWTQYIGELCEFPVIVF
ncbi:MAG: hypothetical protein U0L88_13675 [Acutalibacteraceae bacterium]|nr:hypothetical protein [Acutalibacteraceae bacterium]